MVQYNPKLWTANIISAQITMIEPKFLPHSTYFNYNNPPKFLKL